MDPQAGMLRHVIGLGTRAVNRMEGDYARIIALDNPLLKPYSGMEDARKFSQKNIDVLNILDNRLESIDASVYFKNNKEVIEVASSRYATRKPRSGCASTEWNEREAWLINFDEFIIKTPFVKDMQMILAILEEIYENPIDIEYTVNFTVDGNYRINLLQCRPQQIRWRKDIITVPERLDVSRIFFKSTGHFLGGSILTDIRWIIYIHPTVYSSLNLSDKYSVARCIGKINRQIQNRAAGAGHADGPGTVGHDHAFPGRADKIFGDQQHVDHRRDSLHA